MVVSGPKPAFEEVQPYLETIAASGVSYVGEGELARICKIAHNVFLGVVIQNLAEITILAQKAGVPRHAFLNFMNSSVLGSTFTKIQEQCAGQSRLDHDIYADAAAQGSRSWPQGRTRSRRRNAGDGGDARGATEPYRRGDSSKTDPAAYLEKDFAALMETVALAAGMKLKRKTKPCPAAWKCRTSHGACERLRGREGA